MLVGIRVRIDFAVAKSTVLDLAPQTNMCVYLVVYPGTHTHACVYVDLYLHL
jgi:hypothetical protein